MKDGIIKADGTSRLARSVADFKTKYPTYDDFSAALVAGTLPLDILFNESGWSQLPDFLNQANLLKVATAALYSKDGTAVPDDIFALIPPILDRRLSMDLLWENASPTSAFAAQTVSVDLSKYDMIAVLTDHLTIAKKGVSASITTYHALYTYQSYGYQVRLGQRKFTASETGITFDAGWAMKGSNSWTYESAVNNSAAIPVAIYGIKGVSA